MKIRVYYEDTDAGGIVYHTNYLKFCERARSEIFFQNGLKPFDESGGWFVVKEIKADFLGSAKLGDTLEVDTKLLNKKRVSIWLKQRVLLEKEVIFEMEILLVFVKNQKPTKIPEEFLELFS